MDVDILRARNLGKNVMTVRQQVQNLKAWVRMKEEELQKHRESTASESNESKDSPQRESTITDTLPEIHRNELNSESIEILPTHQNFQSLLTQKLREEPFCSTSSTDGNPVQKRPFLKKGEGLMRFRMKPQDFQLKKHSNTANDKSVNSEHSSLSKPVQSVPLKAFEQLEQRLDDSSFCSSSSLVAQLMEDSIKSTPIKNNENTDPREKNSTKSSLFETDFRTLDVIDEEPSRLNCVQDDTDKENHEKNAQADLVTIDNFNEQRYENYVDQKQSDGSETCSSCSCCQDTTNYMSTSVSIFAEETIYSPQKKELSRAIRCTKIDQSIDVKEYSCNLEETNNNEENLKCLLQTRLLELEAEIDVFKTENSHMTKLRNNYEKEYNQFCQERVALLEKIRAEHLSDVKQLENEKKKLQAEKKAFEKYIKEVKNRPTKEEKEEIRLLKEEVKLMKEEINKRESRWAAAQARIRTEVKLLKDRNAMLQEELKELKKTPKKVTFAPGLKKSKSSSSINLRTKCDTSKSTDSIANKSVSFSNSSQSDSLLDIPSISDSGICQSLDENCDSFARAQRRSVCLSSYLSASTDKETDETSDEVSTSDFSSKDTSDVDVKWFIDSNGNREKVYADGRKEIWSSNGSVKKISADGRIAKTIFYNDDIEEVHLEKNLIKYYHADSRTWHTKFSDGLEIKEFPDGQIEKYFADGSKEITSPDGTVFTVSAIGEKRWNLKDGSIVFMNDQKQEKRIIFPNGEIELHTLEFKRREYPDGTVKTVYNASGMQETKYPNGRIRLKARDGTLVSDTEIA